MGTSDRMKAYQYFCVVALVWLVTPQAKLDLPGEARIQPRQPHEVVMLQVRQPDVSPSASAISTPDSQTRNHSTDLMMTSKCARHRKQPGLLHQAPCCDQQWVITKGYELPVGFRRPITQKVTHHALSLVMLHLHDSRSSSSW